MAKKILLIEDEPDIRKITKIRLQKKGYEIDEAENGKEALDKLRAKHYDLLLIDISMPVMSGEELCKEIQKDEKLKAIPSMVFTASAITNPEELVKQLQVKDYIIKPYEPEDLLNKVAKLLGE